MQNAGLEGVLKPLLRKIDRMWFCRCNTVTGLGYTPLMAWEDWADLTRNHWRRG